LGDAGCRSKMLSFGETPAGGLSNIVNTVPLFASLIPKSPIAEAHSSPTIVFSVIHSHGDDAVCPAAYKSPANALLFAYIAQQYRQRQWQRSYRCSACNSSGDDVGPQTQTLGYQLLRNHRRRQRGHCHRRYTTTSYRFPCDHCANWRFFTVLSTTIVLCAHPHSS